MSCLVSSFAGKTGPDLSVFCSVVITFITIASALRRAEMSTVARCKGILSIEIVHRYNVN